MKQLIAGSSHCLGQRLAACGQDFFYVVPGVGLMHAGQFLWCAAGNDLSAAVAGARSQVNYPVSVF
jgi:hypothetical protein